MAAEVPLTRPSFQRKRNTEMSDDLSDSESSTLAVDSKSKSRARINMACVHCRHRKIKCDGAQPSCATCKRLRRQCEYEPVSEFENLMSRERKRRNKEKKVARLSSLSVFAGNSPLSALHPGSWTIPSGSVRHYLDLSAPVSPSYIDPAPVQPGAPLRNVRPRSRTVAMPLPNAGPRASEQLPFHLSSVSQPQTPDGSDRSTGLIAVEVEGQGLEFAANHYFFDVVPGRAETSQAPTKPLQPCSPASASNAELVVSSIGHSELPLAVPTSAHVRPIDLPAPHGHFDFASVPFPTQDCFSAEAPLLSLRRRSSVPELFGYVAQLRRPSIAELATVGLVQKVADKRAEKVQPDMAGRLRSAQALAFANNDTFIASWRETTSQLWRDNFSLQSTTNSPEVPQPVAFDALAAAHCAQKSNDDTIYSNSAQQPYSRTVLNLADLSSSSHGFASPASVLLHQGGLRYGVADSSTGPSSVGESSLGTNTDDSYFTRPTATSMLDAWSPAVVSVSAPPPPTATTANLSSSLACGPWTALQQQMPILSPVTELQQAFHSLPAGLQTPNYLDRSSTSVNDYRHAQHYAGPADDQHADRQTGLGDATTFSSHYFSSH